MKGNTCRRRANVYVIATAATGNKFGKIESNIA